MIFVISIFKGFILGCTAIIPGISIGTMALVLGVYEKTIDYFSLIIAPKQWTTQKIREIIIFFLPLAIGIASAMVALSTLLSWLLTYYPAFVQLAFMGVVIGSIPYIYKTHAKGHISKQTILYILIGAVIILFFAFSNTIFSGVDKETTKTAEYITLDFKFTSIVLALSMGTISSACGLIPGVSGSFVLLIIGYYQTYLTIIKTLNIALLIPLLIGHLLGFILTSVVLKILLHKYPSQSHAIIFGMILSSAIAIFPFVTISSVFGNTTIQNILSIVIALGCFAFGISLSKISMLGNNNQNSSS